MLRLLFGEKYTCVSSAMHAVGFCDCFFSFRMYFVRARTPSQAYVKAMSVTDRFYPAGKGYTKQGTAILPVSTSLFDVDGRIEPVMPEHAAELQATA